MNSLKLRKMARASMSLGSLSVICGGALMAFGAATFGDIVMIAGFALLILGVVALAQTPPPGDSDAR